MQIKVSDAIQFLSIVVSVLVSIAVIRSGYEVWEAGSIPPKKVEYSILSAQDPFQNFPDEKRDLSVQIKSGNEILGKVWAVQTFLSNDGKSPILPSDIFEPFSVNVDRPWRIVAVSNNSALSKSAVKSKWRRVSDQSYAIEPALMNPNDWVSATVYLTLHDEEKVEKDVKPELRWTARVNNLAGIDKKADPEFARDVVGPSISVTHEGWAVIFLVGLFFSQLALGSLLLIDRKIANARSINFSLLMATFGTINLCASEALTTLIFPSRFSAFLNAPFSMNLPILVVNFGIFIFLLRLKSKAIQ